MLLKLRWIIKRVVKDEGVADSDILEAAGAPGRVLDRHSEACKNRNKEWHHEPRTELQRL